ncbi:hypothetical protein AB0P19_07085 [Microbacterium oleivorans]|uniref:hypothetical protein n=1 Tax=Microbacterium oleivorans TaxID=273677 RepID=UPI0034318474
MSDLVNEVFHQGDKVLVTSKNKPPYEAIYHGRINYRPGGLHGPLAQHPYLVFVEVQSGHMLRKVDVSRLEKPRAEFREDGTRNIPGFCRHGYKNYECKAEPRCQP